MGSVKIPDSKIVHKQYIKRDCLGQGSDGLVTRYEHKTRKGEFIAVKEPARTRSSAGHAIRQEIAVMKSITKCENIIDMLGFDESWKPHGPGIFYEYCQLGDATSYPKLLRQKFGHVPEETVWKFFADVAKGLDHLHGLEPPMVHGDLKCDNILVSWSAPLKNGTPPILPTFKIADLSRSVQYSPEKEIRDYMGTYEYAPPLVETRLGARPAVDIWGLAASLQSFALGIVPCQNKEKFLKDWKRDHGASKAPRFADLEKEEWRKLIPVIWRPLNADAEERAKDWDVFEENTIRYSDSLNRWYTACMDTNQQTRLNARDLAKWLVPVAQRQIRILHAERKLQAARRAVKKMPKRGGEGAGKVEEKKKAAAVGGRQAPRMKAVKPVKATENEVKVEVVKLRREDFGLRRRRSSEIRRKFKNMDESEVRLLREREQKYLRGMKKKV